jgi:hypothetical protein
LKHRGTEAQRNTGIEGRRVNGGEWAVKSGYLRVDIERWRVEK